MESHVESTALLDGSSISHPSVTQTITSGEMAYYSHRQQPPLLQPGPAQYSPAQGSYGQYGNNANRLTPQQSGYQVIGPMGIQGNVISLPPMSSTAQPVMPGQDYASQQGFDTTGQLAPPGMKPRVTATLWEDEGSLCFQVEAKGVCVARREDNHMINGTKLLNVAGMTRGRRDGILKSEKIRHAVKIGPMNLKGVWIPFERALDFANKEKITELLYPLFVHNIGALLYHPTNQHRAGVIMAAAERRKQEQNQLRKEQDPGLPSMQSHHHHSMHNSIRGALPRPQHSLAPDSSIGRPNIHRAHTFPTPPTSASSVMGNMGNSDGSFQWSGQGMASAQRQIDRAANVKSIISSPMHQEEPILSNIGLGRQRLRSGMHASFSPPADDQSCLENNSQQEVDLQPIASRRSFDDSLSPTPEDRTGSPRGRDAHSPTSSNQDSVSTEQTSISLMEYEVDSSEDDLDAPSEAGLVYADSNLEQRVLCPRAYFKKLENLEYDIYENSGVCIHKLNSRSEPHTRCRVLPPGISHANDLKPSPLLDSEIQPDILIRLIECRNIIQRSYHNLLRLQKVGFCGEWFSILTEESQREGVAQLIRVDISDIEELKRHFEITVGKFESSVLSASELPLSRPVVVVDARLQMLAKDLANRCTDILNRMGLTSTSTTAAPVLQWQRAVQVIDLGVLSYAGAHIERFDIKFLDVEVSCFKLPNTGSHLRESLEDKLEANSSSSKIHCTSSNQASAPRQSAEVNWPPITMRRRKLQCLGNFLGGMEVWVFHQGLYCQDILRLCLLSNIETLTDVWGPSWKMLCELDPSRIERLDIGNGLIIPWMLPLDAGSEIKNGSNASLDLQAGEIYCHWIAAKKWNSEDIAMHQAGLERRYILETDKLLIGAKEHGLRVNKECVPTVEYMSDIKTKLNNKSALRSPGSDRPRRYADSLAVQVQGSVLSAVSAGGIITYKRRAGHNMKDVLVERWRNTKNRNPAELEAFCGIEVSLCTQNARRRRLLDLLNSATMRKYLKGVYFDWISDECEKAYFDSLRSRKTFRKFWNTCRDWRQSAGEAISLCLDALEVTGIDEDSGELNAFWAETFEEGAEFFSVEEWFVTLFRNEHTWTRFLNDSSECLTMAVMDPRCLDFNDAAGWGRRCRKPRPTSDGNRIACNN